MRTTAEDAMARALVAARAEFAEHGLAGGRIDRISAAAGVSKERLYVYFTSKHELWLTVMTGVIQELDQVGAVDSLDGAAIVGRLFDHFVAEQGHLRLFLWHAVEGEPMGAGDDLQAELHRKKIELVAKAQRQGRLDRRLPAETIVSLLIAVAANCAGQWLSDPRSTRLRRTIRAAAAEVGGRILPASN